MLNGLLVSRLGVAFGSSRLQSLIYQDRLRLTIHLARQLTPLWLAPMSFICYQNKRPKNPKEQTRSYLDSTISYAGMFSDFRRLRIPYLVPT